MASTASVKSGNSVTSVTSALAVLALLAPFKHRCGFLEEGQPLTWPPSNCILRPRRPSPSPTGHSRRQVGRIATARKPTAMLRGALATLAPVLGKRAPSTWLSCSRWLSCLASWHLGAFRPVLGERARRMLAAFPALAAFSLAPRRRGAAMDGAIGGATPPVPRAGHRVRGSASPASRCHR
jgi:hypothetical protein